MKERMISSALKLMIYTFTIVLIRTGSVLCQHGSNDYLLKIIDDTDRCGYINSVGDTIIQPGKYLFCYTDTFKTWASVATIDGSIIAIDRDEEKKFNIYNYDNGPDYPSDGLFRIIKNGKIGYASTNGEIVIKPKYDCALPFENGRAKVSKKCSGIKHGEHTTWESDNWYYIDSSGNRILE